MEQDNGAKVRRGRPKKPSVADDYHEPVVSEPKEPKVTKRATKKGAAADAAEENPKTSEQRHRSVTPDQKAKSVSPVKKAKSRNQAKDDVQNQDHISTTANGRAESSNKEAIKACRAMRNEVMKFMDDYLHKIDKSYNPAGDH